MRISRQPFQLGVLMAQYAHHTCLLCHSRPSIALHPDNHHQSNITQNDKPSTLNINVSKLNKGILCYACHESIHWLPKTFNVRFREESLSKKTLNKQSINKHSVNQQNIEKYTQQTHLVIQPATYYQHPIDKLILKFKSGDMSSLPILVHLIRQLSKPDGCHSKNSALVAVPTTQARLMSRGFNPLSILVNYLSHHWQIPIWHGVQRIDNVSSQKALNRQQRIINVQGAFRVMDTDINSIKNRSLLLFDDVVTTGSTLRELACTLDNNTTSLPNLLPLRGYCLAHVDKL